MVPNILILAHHEDEFNEVPYLLKEMVGFWRERGLRVDIQHGLNSVPKAKIAILHIDLTAIPEDYMIFARKYPVVVNGRVSDISKNLISKNIVYHRDAYDGPVIVKTNHNCGGAGEARLVRRKGGLPWLAHRVRRALPWSYRAHFSDYRIFPSPAQVPYAVWFNHDLMVERFQPERHEDYYCLRTWVFFGNRETNSISYSHQPVVKSANVIRRETLTEVPAELREMRSHLGFDFGKFDYGIANGVIVLYDVNRTPTLGGVSNQQFLPSIKLLAEGIELYL